MQPLRHVPVPLPSILSQQSYKKKSVTWDSGIESVSTQEGFPGKIVTWMAPLLTQSYTFSQPSWLSESQRKVAAPFGSRQETMALSPLETHKDWYCATDAEINRSQLKPTMMWYTHPIPPGCFDTRRFDHDLEKRFFVKRDPFEVIQVYPYRYRQKNSDGGYVFFWLDERDVGYGEVEVHYGLIKQVKYRFSMYENMIDGPYTSYYVCGALSTECTYSMGKLHGSLYTYDILGNRLSHEMWDMGVKCDV